MLAYISTGRREWIILADQFYCIFISALAHQCHITGHIHMGRTGRYARYRMAQGRNAASVQQMFLKVFAETADPAQYHVGTFITNGAVSRIGNDFCCSFNRIDGFHGPFLIQYFFDQICQLTQTDTTGHAFPASLGMAQAQIAQRDIYRAQSMGTGTDTAFHILMQAIQNILGTSGCFNR